MTELDKLEEYLKERSIVYERIDKEPEEKVTLKHFEGLGERHQIIVYDECGKRSWDAICHWGSFGYNLGLLEVMGRPVTINQIFQSLQKAAKEKVSLRFFHITGYNPLSEWDMYIDQLCSCLDRINYTSMFQLGFNNLDYQNYVPLYKERWNIDPDKYSTADMIRGWRNRLRNCTPHVFCVSSSSFQHACCRMGIMMSREKEQVDFWTSMIVNPNKKLTVSSAYKALFDSKVFETPPLMLNPNTGEIKIHKAWE